MLKECLLLGLLVACIPAKKFVDIAHCEIFEEFDLLTRKCQPLPPMLASASLFSNEFFFLEDDQTQTILLDYIDSFDQTAIDCKITVNSENIEIRSTERSKFIEDLTSFAEKIQDLPENTIDFEEMIQKSNDSVYEKMIFHMEKVLSEGKDLLDRSSGTSLPPLMKSYGELLQTFKKIENRCSCLAGFCSVLISFSKNYSGIDSFKYSVTDRMGQISLDREVKVHVLEVDDPPIPISSDIYFDENRGLLDMTSIPFELVLGQDVENNQGALLFNYTMLDPVLDGRVTHCMNLEGSDGDSDRTCLYTPAKGDIYGRGERAEIIIDNKLKVTASGSGNFGNKISLIYREHPFNFIDGKNTGFEVLKIDTIFSKNSSEVTILIFIHSMVTTCDDVKQALSEDITASSFVDVSCMDDGPMSVISNTSYKLKGGSNGPESFTYYIHDGIQRSNYLGRVTFNITSQDDPPRLLEEELTVHFDEDDRNFQIDLPYENPENEEDDEVNCKIFEVSDGLRAIECSCVDESCSARVVNDLEDHPGYFHFKYVIQDRFGLQGESSVGTVHVIVDPVDDPPRPVHQVEEVLESPTSVPLEITFNIKNGFEPEGDLMHYEIVEPPLWGHLSNCDLKVNDLSCTYTPIDGNGSGVGVAAHLTLGNIYFEVRSTGSFGNTYTVKIIDEPLSEPDVFIEGTSIVIALQNGISMSHEIVNLIEEDSFLSSLVEARELTEISKLMSITNLDTSISFMGGEDGFDHFSYKIMSSNNTSPYEGRVQIDIIPVNDLPMGCQYSQFDEAPECGLSGCLDLFSDPNTLQIKPSQLNLRFYDQKHAVCYKSISTEDSPYWKIISDVRDLIGPVIVNEKDLIILKSIKIDEGGGDFNEDTQSLTLNFIESSDEILVPVQNVTVLYDDKIIPSYPTLFKTGTKSADLKDFSLKIKPAGGFFGDVKITLQFQDSEGGTIDIIVPITVNAVSAQHKGWLKLEAVGPSLDKNGIFFNQKESCPYSRDKCESGGECKGDSSPLGVITPSMVKSIYYNRMDDTCYYSTGTTSNDWSLLNTICNISPREYQNCDTDGILSATCILDKDPMAQGLIPGGHHSFVYDRVKNTCYRSAKKKNALGTSDDWEIYDGTGTVTLEWNEFLVTGSSSHYITGYNVYRRLANEEFDYSRPINKEIISSDVRIFVDNSHHSWSGPVSRTVYYYEVRPLINLTLDKSLSTGTQEHFSVVRLLVPDINRVFIHRWIANQKMCHLLQSPSDPVNHYRCPYEGPGDLGLKGSQNFYDIGSDYLVDKVESGCPYSSSDACNTHDGSCIGIDDPHGMIEAKENSVYYGRTSGTCFLNTSIGKGKTWDKLDASTLIGCRYSKNTCYRTGGGDPEPSTKEDCIGHGNPHQRMNADPGSYYFQESEARCFIKNNALKSWSEILLTNLNLTAYTKLSFTYSKLPPLVNITQADASTMCTHRSFRKVKGMKCMSENHTESIQDPTGKGAYGHTVLNINTDDCFVGTGNAWIKSTVLSTLPSRKMQMVYTQWDQFHLTDDEIHILEEGLSLSSSSKCNSFEASGVEHLYSNSEIPASSNFYTITGTHASNIRSVMTDSKLTMACRSLFGVQDAVGNVMEWVSDRFICEREFHRCSAIIKDDKISSNILLPSGGSLKDLILKNATNDMRAGDGKDLSDQGTPGYDRVRFDGILGPCNDLDSDNLCDKPLESWDLERKLFNGGKLFLPMGILGHIDFPTFNQKSKVAPYMADIGRSSGILSRQLHSDSVNYNMKEIYASHVDGCAAMATGGSYLSEDSAGLYHFKLLPCQEMPYTFSPNEGIKFFKRHPDSEVKLAILISTYPNVSLEITVPDITKNIFNIILATNANAEVVSTGRDVIALINNSDISKSFMIAVENDPKFTSNIMEFMPLTIIGNHHVVGNLNKKKDIGFRCMARVHHYDE